MKTIIADRASGLARLNTFLPQTGSAYQKNRNFDHGVGAHDHVSRLSPYLRHRIVTESEVARAVIARQDRADCEKFIDELCWRTYWKGWLEMRAAVWSQTCNDVEALQASAGADYCAAIAGNSGIDCFDAWADELVTTGYLHNHARMWFASIWIFTLGLPWQLGADFFLRHLLDGDPASNTLSWRWVAGLHTPGKTYLARADNIAHYTGGRFNPVGLARTADPVAGWSNPDAAPIAADDDMPRNGRCGLLVTLDDLSPDIDWNMPPRDTPIAVLDCAGNHSAAVTAFRASAVRSTAARLGGAEVVSGVDGTTAWAARHRIDHIVTLYVPVGQVRGQLADSNVPVIMRRRAWDAAAWPHARGGFFGLKKKIPAILATL
jgi:deoxyribodipyrimidine photo-lyase